jgi:hypothetical protein
MSTNPPLGKVIARSFRRATWRMTGTGPGSGAARGRSPQATLFQDPDR